MEDEDLARLLELAGALATQTSRSHHAVHRKGVLTSVFVASDRAVAGHSRHRVVAEAVAAANCPAMMEAIARDRALSAEVRALAPPRQTVVSLTSRTADCIKLIPDGLFFIPGYNAQAAVNEQQIVLAAEITNISTDFSQLDPMVTATLQELKGWHPATA